MQEGLQLRGDPGSINAAHRDDTPSPSRYVIISGYHDYRTPRRANLHFIADELAKRGSVFFLSLRYSLLTRFTEDPRHGLEQRSNRVEQHANVACYLLRTPIHPCRLPRSLSFVERAVFAVFARWLPAPAREAIATADIIFIESGIAIVYLPLLRRLSPRARIVYIASDSLAAINQASTIRRALRRYASLIDGARLPSPLLRSELPASVPCHFIPHGVEPDKFERIGPSPYDAGTRNAVSVGSMLFDPRFFRIAAPLFSDVTFHIIGSGHEEVGPPNVIYYPEMPFADTLPFIKHADFAIAPYGEGVAPYLTHTSMKLMQYGYLGVPAVCPDVIADQPGRFGYEIGIPSSIRAAVAAALLCKDLPAQSALDWSGVVQRLISPQNFLDTRLAA